MILSDLRCVTPVRSSTEAQRRGVCVASSKAGPTSNEPRTQALQTLLQFYAASAQDHHLFEGSKAYKAIGGHSWLLGRSLRHFWQSSCLGHCCSASAVAVHRGSCARVCHAHPWQWLSCAQAPVLRLQAPQPGGYTCSSAAAWLSRAASVRGCCRDLRMRLLLNCPACTCGSNFRCRSFVATAHGWVGVRRSRLSRTRPRRISSLRAQHDRLDF